MSAQGKQEIRLKSPLDIFAGPARCVGSLEEATLVRKKKKEENHKKECKKADRVEEEGERGCTCLLKRKERGHEVPSAAVHETCDVWLAG